jgi:hypothetical protein
MALICRRVNKTQAADDVDHCGYGDTGCVEGQIEVYPRDLAFYPADGQGEQRNEPVSRHTAFHAAVATPLSIEEVQEIGDRYGCHNVVCQRGPFRVIEFWVDNALMLEMMTLEMQEEYQRSVTPEAWPRILAHWGVDLEGNPLESAA